MRVPLREAQYPTTEARAAFYTALLERVRALPGVRTAAVDSGLPFFGARGSSVDVPEVGGQERRHVLVHETSASYLDVLGARLVAGRQLEAQDVDAGRRVATVNQAFVRRYFGDANPVGRIVRLDYLTRPPISQSENAFEVIGVVQDLRNQGVRRDVSPEVHVPFTVNPRSLNLIVVGAVPPLQLERSVRSQVYALDPQQPVTDVRTFDRPDGRMDLRAAALHAHPPVGVRRYRPAARHHRRLRCHRRTRSRVRRLRSACAWRSAPGPATSSGWSCRAGCGWSSSGLVAGCLVALIAVRFLVDQLWGVSARDPLAYAAVVALLGSVGLAACLWPALRAARVSPLVALRNE